MGWVEMGGVRWVGLGRRREEKGGEGRRGRKRGKEGRRLAGGRAELVLAIGWWYRIEP